MDLGTYDDVVYNHDLTKPLELAFEWTLEEPLEVRDPLSGSVFEGDSLRFECVLVADDQHQPHVKEFKYCLVKGGIESLDITMRRKASEKQNIQRKTEYDLISIISI